MEYFHYPFMIKKDLVLCCSYFFFNPYRIVRKYLQKRGISNPHQYGETPLSTIDSLIKAAGGIKQYQYFADLGAGRGRLAYFIQKKYNCRVYAYERVEIFVSKGQWLYPKVRFCNTDFLKEDLSKMDLIYLYGTMMTENEILLFVNKINLHTKVITISYPLTDYDSRFEILNTIDVLFPWGKTKGYVQSLRK